MPLELEFKVNASAQLIDAIADKVIEKTKPAAEKKPDKVFTVNQIANEVGKTPQTIRMHIIKGLLIAKKTGKSFSITQSNFDKYVNK